MLKLLHHHLINYLVDFMHEICFCNTDSHSVALESIKLFLGLVRDTVLISVCLI